MKKIIFSFIVLFSSVFAKTISLDEMISQMILVGFSGTKPTDKWVEQIAKDIRQNKISGVILFARNIQSNKQLKELTSFLQKSNTSNLPIFISIDQEGGKVQRLKKANGFHDYLSAQSIVNKSLLEAKDEYEKLSSELKEYGFNLNFAPVVDVNINKNSPVIGAKQRAYSDKEEIVSAYASVFINAMHKYKILNAIKHFPGHGSSLSDSHKGFTDITKTWRYEELKPYYNLIKYKKADMVMIGHLSNQMFDKTYPASLSKNIINGILRAKLGFDGVVISDDMQMKAIADNFTLEKSIIKAIDAGVDILLFSSYFSKDSNIVKIVNTVIKQAIKDKRLKRQQIENAYNRVIKLKKSLIKEEL